MLIELLKKTVEKNASDLILVADAPPTLRIAGALVKLQRDPLTSSETKQLAYEMMNSEQMKKFNQDYELDLSQTLTGLGRFRVNIHYQRGSVAIAIRYLPEKVPCFEELGLPEPVRNLVRKRRGLILITGSAGSGKSTTLASLVDLINTERACHIVTIEHPIEYIHCDKKSLIEQREVYVDTHSFKNALKHALRQSPDVILIGEMRDAETIKTALTAAETGHLILATLHTIDACQAVDRIVDSFQGEKQQQIRSQLSMCLQGVVAQILLPRSDGQGQILAVEVMKVNQAIKTAIRNGKTAQIYSSIQTGKTYGMQTMDNSLKALYNAGLVKYEDILPHVKDRTVVSL